MSYQRIDAPNGDAMEDFEIGAVHYGASPLFPAQVEDGQWSRAVPLGFLRTALKNLYGRRWWERLRINN